MKMWKKTLAMLMCCGFVFSTAACTDDNGSGSGSGSGNGDNGGNEQQVLEEKKTYLGDIANALVNAKSFKVELDATVSQSNDSSEMSATIEGDIELTQNADDEALYDMALTMKVSGVSKYDSNDDGDFADEHESNEIDEEINLYVQDGYVYMSEDGEEWRKYYKAYDELLAEQMGETLPEEVTNQYLAMFDKVLNNKLVTGTIDAFKTGVAQTAEIKDGMFVIAFDAKDLVNDTLEMFIADPTIEELADYALAMVDEELTVEGILDKVATYGEKTILDVYGEVDAWLEENYEKGVQEIVELVTKDQAILDSLEEVGLNSKDLEAFENFNVEETLTAMLEAYEMEEATIDEIIAMMMGGAQGEMAPMASEEAPEMTLEAMVEMVKEQYLGVKMSEMIGENEWEEGVAILEKVKVNALSASFGAKYGDNNKVNYIEMAMDFDIDAADQHYEWDGEEEIVTYEDISFAESFTVKISNISASKSAIDFPEELEDAVEFGEPENECTKCGDAGEYEIEVHSFSGDFEVTGVEYLCDDCAQKCTGYINCGNMASHKMMSAYYCDECWDNVTNSLK